MSWAKWLLLGTTAAVAAGVLVVTVIARRDTNKHIDSLERQRQLVHTRHGLLEYAIRGTGEPVLVIHGAGGGFDQGLLLARSFGGDGFRWLSVSRFGYLGSDLPASPSTAAQADALADLLDALGIERASILAMSGGVPPALKFAETFPDRTRRLVLLSSAPFTPFSPDVEGRPVPGWVYSALLGNDVVYWLLTRAFRGALATAFDARPELMAKLKPRQRLMVDELIDGFLPASRRVAGVNNEGAAVDPQASYALQSISAPTLVVHARDDRINPFEVAVTIAKQVPDARLISLEQGGHLLLGHHDELRSEIGEFLHVRPEDR